MNLPDPNHREPVDLRADGLLWMINKSLLHPRGFALAVEPETGQLAMMGDGTEPWSFGGINEDELFARFNAMLNRTADAVRGPVSDT